MFFCTAVQTNGTKATTQCFLPAAELSACRHLTRHTDTTTFYRVIRWTEKKSGLVLLFSLHDRPQNTWQYRSYNTMHRREEFSLRWRVSTQIFFMCQKAEMKGRREASQRAETMRDRQLFEYQHTCCRQECMHLWPIPTAMRIKSSQFQPLHSSHIFYSVVNLIRYTISATQFSIGRLYVHMSYWEVDAWLVLNIVQLFAC